MAEVPPDPLIGKVLNGRFTILEPLGVGGMGKVYKAMQSPLDRMVALKVLNPKYSGTKDPGFERRFFLEAAMTAKLMGVANSAAYRHRGPVHGLERALAVLGTAVLLGSLPTRPFAAALHHPSELGVQVIDQRAHRRGIGLEVFGARAEAGGECRHGASERGRTLQGRKGALNFN